MMNDVAHTYMCYDVMRQFLLDATCILRNIENFRSPCDNQFLMTLRTISWKMTHS
jgi:hypothetical protein